MKKIFLIILLFILLFILSSCVSKYKTSSLFKSNNYEYMITYPVKQPNEWFLFYGSTDATIYETSHGALLETIAIIIKQSPSTFGTIEIFLLDKNGKLYKEWINNLKNGKVDFVYKIEDFSNSQYNKLNIPYNTFSELYKNNVNKKSLIELFVDIGEDKILVFTFNNKNNKKLEKEIYNTINSLKRYKRINE